MSWSATPRGLIPREVIRYFNKKCKGEIWRNTKLRRPALNKINEQVEAIAAKSGGYSFLGLTNFVPWLDWLFRPNKRRQFCSQTVVQTYRKAGYGFYPGESPDRVSPIEIAYRMRQLVEKDTGWRRVLKWNFLD